MLNFMQKITNDKEFKDRFIEYAHSKEKELDFLNADISDGLYNFIYDSFRKYAKENSYEIKEDKEVQERTKQFCVKYSKEVNTYVIKQFSRDLNNYLE